MRKIHYFANGSWSCGLSTAQLLYQKSIINAAETWNALYSGKRGITRLYTSYFAGRLFPTQLAMRNEKLATGWKQKERGDGWSGAQGHVAGSCSEHINEEKELGSPLDEVRKGEAPPPRSYFPLREVAKIELQGDYFTEGGLHQEALECYGVVGKAYQIAYPEGHHQQVGILIKLSGALRRTGRLESSKANAKRALRMAEAADAPHLELIVEGLLELGLTQDALNEGEAGPTFEEAVTVVQEFHDFGSSHKMLRLVPRLSRRFNLNFEEKFLYFSPFDWDRTYALADQCLHLATNFFRKRNEHAGVQRVLQTRVQLLDKKFFNMRDFAGRIHTMRGHWMRQARSLTDAPTPDELLRYSPTIHQVYRDFQYELNAPIGRENEVASGVNRVVLDMGNPYRRRGRQSREMMRDADRNFAKYTRRSDFTQ